MNENLIENIYKIYKNKRNSNELARIIGLTLMSKNENIYHNEKHVLEVEAFTQEIFNELKECHIILDIIKKCIKTAAILHDVAHPAGYTNHYIHEHIIHSLIIKSNHMETKHSKITEFLLLKTNSFNIFGKDLQEYYINVIEKLIMATDINTYHESDLELELELPILIIRCADLSNLSKSLDEHIKSIHKLNNELGFVLSPQDNIDFIIKYVLPIFTKLHTYCESQKSQEWINSINQKIEYWKSMK
jgi:hypothetical protein